MKLTKHTSLETSTEITDTLQWKLDNIGDKDKEAVLADYIALAVDNLTNKKDYLKSLGNEIRAETKRIDRQILSIKQGAGEFLLDNGIVKLSGGYVSSITVSYPKEATVTKTTTEKIVVTATKEQVNEALIALGFAEVKQIETEKAIEAKPATIRINKRKIAIPEVVESKEVKK